MRRAFFGRPKTPLLFVRVVQRNERVWGTLARRWAGVDLGQSTVTISLQGFAVTALNVRRQRQLERQLAEGLVWPGQDQVFTAADAAIPHHSTVQHWLGQANLTMMLGLYAHVPARDAETAAGDRHQ